MLRMIGLFEDFSRTLIHMKLGNSEIGKLTYDWEGTVKQYPSRAS